MRNDSRPAPGLGRTHTLVATLVGATLLVGALAVVARSVFFPTRLRGWGEVTREGRVAGWAVDRSEPSRRVEVQLYVDGRFAEAGVAEWPRQDVVAAGEARDERCGYSFGLPPLAEGAHEARVFAAHAVEGGAYRTLQMTGAPLRFTVDAAGKVSASNPR